MKILVIGSGGREHAIIKKLSESKRITKLYALSGNAGISQFAECVAGNVTDIDAVVEKAKNLGVDVVFVAPDDPLALGMVDALTSKGIRAFGPTKAGAQLESSKAFSKAFMQKYGIPTASYKSFDDYEKAVEYSKNQTFPIVVKADGLALGKGVIICSTFDEAKDAIGKMMKDGAFSSSGRTVVIEEFLQGREVTLLAFTDGKTIKPMPSSQDHKRAFDGDKGLNTGGMGAFAPSPFFTAEKQKEAMEKIILPTIDGLRKEGIIYKGVLYFGLMMTADGIKVIEYNARFGDPETQVILPLLKTDLSVIMDACIDGRLHETEIEWLDETALTVVVASGGYPENVIKGYEIEVGKLDGVTLYHAGTTIKDDKLVTNGGRVFSLTAVADNLSEARKKVYGQIDKIKFQGARYRSDIGKS